MRHTAHSLNLIVKNWLDVTDFGIEKIRDCVTFWMLTLKRIKKFSNNCQFLHLCTFKIFVLDYKIIRNSTFLMLQTTIPYKEVTDRLKRLNKTLTLVIPNENDWEWLKMFVRR